MTPPSPILLTVEQYSYLDNRNRKILKLCIMKEKSQAQGQKEKRKSFMQSNGLKVSNLSAIADILPKLDQSNLQNIADSQRDQSQQESYDSDVHNVFENFKQKARSLFVDGVDNASEYKEVLVIRNIKESQLVINFKTANQPPSDFNNCQNEPKIVVSQPPSGVSGLKFSSAKTNKEPESNVIQQKQSYQTQNQNQQTQAQSNFYPQPLQSNNFRQGYQNAVNPNINYQAGQQNTMYHQNSAQQAQNKISYQVPLQSSSSLSMVMDIQNQFVSTGQNNNNFQNSEKTSSPKKLSNQANNQNNQNYQPQQPSSTTNYSNNGGNTFTNMMANNNNNNSMGNNFNFSSNSNAGHAPNTNNLVSPNKINSATSPNKKGKLSFMEYYHSVPVKNPTNILQKYMKRKK